MRRSVDHVRFAGAALARGRPFRDEALAALYALPSGTVLARLALPEGRTRGLDAARRDAIAKGGAHWWIRVGDRAARLHWGPGSARYSVLDVHEMFRDPDRFQAIRSGEF